MVVFKYGYKIKVKEYEVVHSDCDVKELPDVTIEVEEEEDGMCFEDRCIFTVQFPEKIEYKREAYNAKVVRLEDGTEILLDARYAPYANILEEEYNAEYTDEEVNVVSYQIIEYDENGNVVFSHEIDDNPHVIHHLNEYFCEQLGIENNEDFNIVYSELTNYSGDNNDVVIPDGVTAIGEFAFEYHTEIIKLHIPDSVTSIGYGAFRGCGGLTTIEVDPGNPTYCSENNCLIEKATNKLILGCRTSIIPDTVTAIEDYAFSESEELTDIAIPHGVTSIGQGAFDGCSKLTSINIPDSVTSIGKNAFRNSGLTNIKLPNGVTYIEEEDPDLPF